MPHVPKRAVLHGSFLPSAETPCVPLKPGQGELVRRGRYSAACEGGDGPEETYIAASPNVTVSSKPGRGQMLSEDYMEVRSPVRPPGPNVELVKQGGSAWKSESHSAHFHPGEIQPFRRAGPAFEAYQAAAYSSKSPFGSSGTSSQALRGWRGEGDSVDVLRDELAAGTPRGAGHVPGYKGFLPSSCAHQLCVAEFGATRAVLPSSPRSVDKSRIMNSFHQNVPGYAGHLPASATNNVGQRSERVQPRPTN